MFKKKFNEQEKVKGFQDWLSSRNPAQLGSQLNKELSVLMIYGLKDNRVDRGVTHIRVGIYG